MPFYEYVCTNCGAATEILQKLSDAPATTCPKCHAEALTKQISAAGFRLKGGGWYETDFKSDGQKNLVKSGEGEGGNAKGSGASGEAKDSHGGTGGAKADGAAKAESAPKSEGASKTESAPAPAASSTPAA